MRQNLARYALNAPIPLTAVATTDQTATTVTLGRFKGQGVALYFGHTYCPDLCLATPTQLTRVKKRLGPQGQRLRVVFVSMDPQRDKPERMRTYLSNFDSSFVGMTGSPQEVTAITQHHGVSYEVQGPQQTDASLIARSGYAYLLDRQGTARNLFPLDAALEVLVRRDQALQYS